MKNGFSLTKQTHRRRLDARRRCARVKKFQLRIIRFGCRSAKAFRRGCHTRARGGHDIDTRWMNTGDRCSSTLFEMLAQRCIRMLDIVQKLWYNWNCKHVHIYYIYVLRGMEENPKRKLKRKKLSKILIINRN